MGPTTKQKEPRHCPYTISTEHPAVHCSICHRSPTICLAALLLAICPPDHLPPFLCHMQQQASSPIFNLIPPDSQHHRPFKQMAAFAIYRRLCAYLQSLSPSYVHQMYHCPVVAICDPFNSTGQVTNDPKTLSSTNHSNYN